jgi:hypothetical protein
LEWIAFEIERNFSIGLEHAVPLGAANRARLGLAGNLSTTASTEGRHLLNHLDASYQSPIVR